MDFNLNQSRLVRAIRLSECFCFKLLPVLKNLLFLGSILFFILFANSFFSASGKSAEKELLGATLIFLATASFLWQWELFFNLKIKKLKPVASLKMAAESPEDFNFADFLDFEAAKILNPAVKFAEKQNQALTTGLIFHSFLASNSSLVDFVFNRLLFNLSEIRRIQKQALISIPAPNNNFQEFLTQAMAEAQGAQQQNNDFISPGNLLTALAKHDRIFKKILEEANLKTEDVRNLAWWWESNQKKIEESKKFWKRKNLAKKSFGMAKTWSTGLTPTADRVAVDWTDELQKNGWQEIIGHEKEVQQIERILAKEGQNNVLVVGEPGSGRGAMTQALVQKIIFGESLSNLNYKRVLELNPNSLTGLCQTQEEAIALLDQIFKEIINAKNIILIIRDFQNFIGGENQRPGNLDISGVLSNYLSVSQFRLLAITNFTSFHQIVASNPIAKFFEKVEIEEVSKDETIMLLELFLPSWEAKYKKFISYQALKELVEKADRYLPASPFPQKATDLMAELLAECSRSADRIILPEHIDRLLSEKTKIPIGQLSLRERETLLQMESLLGQRVIGQKEALEEISSALRRARADITIRKNIMGSFLFLGPTGVGKTETAKALAATYFGSESRIIRLDLSEFQNPQDLKRLIGSGEEQSFFVNQIRENPFSLILLDEIEKAHPNVLNLFLQVLDEGFMHDGLGRKVNFANTMIIATSNAGHQIILQAIEQKQDMTAIKKQLLDYVFNQEIFRPEFVNRFDAMVVFKSLTRENLLAIADLMLQKLKKNLLDKGIEFVISKELIAEIARLGFDPVFGARSMTRVIQDKVENVIASALLANEIKSGDKIILELPGFNLKTVF